MCERAKLYKIPTEPGTGCGSGSCVNNTPSTAGKTRASSTRTNLTHANMAAPLRESLLVVQRFSSHSALATMAVQEASSPSRPPLLQQAQSAPTLLSPIVASSDVPPTVMCDECEDDASVLLSTNEACTICLGTSGMTETRMLGCGHVFCAGCITTHVTMQLRSHRPVCCPNCKRAADGAEVDTLCPGLRRKLRNERGDATVETHAPVLRDEELTPAARREQRRIQRTFEATARREHMKLCPRCSAPITKTGGCDRMRCRCGHAFNWSSARTVVPCNRLHTSEGTWWFHTCRGCTCGASSKRVAANTGVALAAAPMAAAAAGLAVGAAALSLAVAAVPAAIFSPFAIAYEPVRQLKKYRNPSQRHRNPMAAAAGSGLILPFCLLWLAFHDDDD